MKVRLFALDPFATTLTPVIDIAHLLRQLAANAAIAASRLAA